MIKKIFLIGAFMLFTMQMSAQMVALRTDVVKDAFMIPNLGVDFVIGNRTTVGVDLFGARKIYGNVAEIIGVTPRLRYWLSGRPFSRLFVGINAQAANYTINWDDKSYHGNSIAAGLSLGYAFTVSEHFNIELSGGTDALYYNQKEYMAGDSYINYGERTNSTGIIMSPRFEISLMYIIR